MPIPTTNLDPNEVTRSSYDELNQIIRSLPLMWSFVHAPAANTKATVTNAAVPGYRHVCYGITASLAASAAATAVVVQVTLRDGASGTGTILWTGDLALTNVAGMMTQYYVTDLNIVGSVNTAMTLEFASAAGANTLEKVTITGYDTL